jgi:hypothetical protein
MNKFSITALVLLASVFILTLAGCPGDDSPVDQGPKVTSLQVCKEVNKYFASWGHKGVGTSFSMLNDDVETESDESRLSHCVETLNTHVTQQRDLKYISKQLMPCINSAIRTKGKKEIERKVKVCNENADRNMTERGKFIFLNLIIVPRMTEATPDDLRKAKNDFFKSF